MALLRRLTYSETNFILWRFWRRFCCQVSFEVANILKYRKRYKYIYACIYIHTIPWSEFWLVLSFHLTNMFLISIWILWQIFCPVRTEYWQSTARMLIDCFSADLGWFNYWQEFVARNCGLAFLYHQTLILISIMFRKTQRKN